LNVPVCLDFMALDDPGATFAERARQMIPVDRLTRRNRTRIPMSGLLVGVHTRGLLGRLSSNSGSGGLTAVKGEDISTFEELVKKTLLLKYDGWVYEDEIRIMTTLDKRDGSFAFKSFREEQLTLRRGDTWPTIANGIGRRGSCDC
jgi:hypothetical protein